MFIEWRHIILVVILQNLTWFNSNKSLSLFKQWCSNCPQYPFCCQNSHWFLFLELHVRHSIELNLPPYNPLLQQYLRFWLGRRTVKTTENGKLPVTTRYLEELCQVKSSTQSILYHCNSPEMLIIYHNPFDKATKTIN